MKNNKTALITGASKGLGYAVAEYLAKKGWNLLINARDTAALLTAKKRLEKFTEVTAIAGDVREEIHLLELAEALDRNRWRLDLLINNASALGVSPLKPLLDHPIENLHIVFHTNMIAPISLLQKVKPYFNFGTKIINISSDSAKEPYETWGAYGGSKAGMDHMTAVLSKEYPKYYFYAFDPGDMQTDMHQAAFPGEDITDRPFPTESAVPAMIKIIEENLPSDRYTINSLQKLTI